MLIHFDMHIFVILYTKLTIPIYIGTKHKLTVFFTEIHWNQMGKVWNQ